MSVSSVRVLFVSSFLFWICVLSRNFDKCSCSSIPIWMPSPIFSMFCLWAVSAHDSPLWHAEEGSAQHTTYLIPGKGHSVQGKTYKVDNQMLKFLDVFASVPTVYQRAPIKAEVKEDVSRTAQKPMSQTVLHCATDSHGDHGLEYIIREAHDWRSHI